jgi:DNA-directed RNA polymerase specialized sigma24 family protein
MIYRAIAHLQGKQKDVMALIALGWDHRSISDQLQMSDTHVKSTLHRARIVLREILAATFGTAND